MKYILFGELLLSILAECALRSAVRDAIEYKRSKKQRKLFYMGNSPFQNIMRVYSYKQSNAPRHMLLFQVMRILNLIAFLAIAFTSFFSNLTELCDDLFQIKIYCLYIPFCLYVAYYVFFFSGISGKKRIDFSYFKKP